MFWLQKFEKSVGRENENENFEKFYGRAEIVLSVFEQHLYKCLMSERMVDGTHPNGQMPRIPTLYHENRVASTGQLNFNSQIL